MKTIEEVMEQLKQIDEVTLLEVLNISSEDIIDRFRDKIEDDPERYRLELAQWFDEDTDVEEENT